MAGNSCSNAAERCDAATNGPTARHAAINGCHSVLGTPASNNTPYR